MEKTKRVRSIFQDYYFKSKEINSMIPFVNDDGKNSNRIRFQLASGTNKRVEIETEQKNSERKRIEQKTN